MTIHWLTERFDTVVARDGACRLVMVTAAAPRAQRRRVERVARHVAAQTGFAVSFHASHPPDSTRRHAVVLINGRIVIGYALMQMVAHTRVVTWAELDALSSGQSLPLIGARRWALGLIWVAETARGRGVAPWIIRTASAYVGIPIEQLAWVGPFSIAGERLARRMCPAQIIVA